MADGFNLVTAILGLIAAVLAVKSNLKGGSNNKNNEFAEFKSALNAFGVLALVLCFYFGFMIAVIEIPKMLMSDDNDKEIRQDFAVQELLDSGSYTSNADLIYIASSAYYSNNEKDEQLQKALNIALREKEYDLVPKIVAEFYSNNERDDAANSAIKTLCAKKEYKYAIETAALHYSNNDKDESLDYIIKQISKEDNK